MARSAGSTVHLGTLDDLSRGNTFVHFLDPRGLLIITILFVILVVSFGKYEISAMLPFFLYPAVLTGVGNFSVRMFIKRILLVSPFAVLLGIFNPLLDTQPLVQIGSVTISGGWISFFSILLKFFLCLWAALLLIAAAGFDRACLAMQKLRVPRIFVLQLMFLYRYLFVLLEDAGRMIRARNLRSFGRRGMEIRVYGSMAGHLLLHTMDRAERISQAMYCRGFDENIRTARTLNFKYADAIFIAVWIVLFALFRIVDVPELAGHWIGRIFA